MVTIETRDFFKGNVVAHGVIASVSGGTVSAMMGGKFANGAMTGAFGYVLNHCGTGACSRDDGDLGSPESNRQGLENTSGDRAGLSANMALLGVTAGGGTVGMAVSAYRAAAAGMTLSEYMAITDVAFSTGRTWPLSVGEAALKKQAEAGLGSQLMAKAMSDPRLKGAGQWLKYELRSPNGTVHYIRERATGIMRDFKFKD
jgi:hypothetical protein